MYSRQSTKGKVLKDSGCIRIVAVTPKLVDQRREKDEDVVHQQSVTWTLVGLVIVDGELGYHDPDSGDDRGEAQHEPDEQEHLDATLAHHASGVGGATVQHFVRNRVDHEEADRGQNATNVVRKVPRLWMDRSSIDCDPPSGEEQE